MDKSQAQISTKKVQTQITSLTPSALITLFEIDCSTIGRDTGYIPSSILLNNTDSLVFRIHNNIKLINTSIYYQNKEYKACPVDAEGFEVSSNGKIPTPRLTISVPDAGIEALKQLKRVIFEIGDLTGATVTRIRTFAKYLDSKNFIDQIVPDDFEPDQYAEFPRDVFYIDRKAQEDKNTLQFELGSIIDIQNILLPSRLVISNRCTAFYRGEGCNYEFATRGTAEIHGNAILPAAAPVVANDRDELITNIIGVQQVLDKGEFQVGKIYNKGDGVFISKGGRKYYYVAKNNNPPLPPPNINYWVSDSCSKSTKGCKLRWGTDGSVIVGSANLTKGQLPYVGFPATSKLVR